MKTKLLTRKSLKRLGLTLGLVLATATILTPTAQASETLIPDQALATCINENLSGTGTERTENTPITQTDLQKLTGLMCRDRAITDLSGLEQATNLTHLVLTGNKVTDITPLAKLTNLTYLYLDGNKIIDITPLANLTNLFKLYIYGNKITDITPLAKLTNLTLLNLGDNKIIDITPLANLTQLTQIVLASNKITDITPLANLTQLTALNLYNNEITDLTPLDNLTKLTELILGGNPVSSFTDIVSYPFVKEINWLASTGVTTGYPDKTFRPHDSVSRAAMAAFLYRLEGKPAYTAPAKSPFTDIKPGDDFYKEICWLASKGITTGYADGSFKPWDPIARDAMAAFLHRYDSKVAASKLPVKLAEKKFTDTSKTPFAKDITWLSSTGVTTGYADNSFRPFENIERGAIAAFFYRMKH